ncbi:MAG: M3 family metallopeptidase [Thermoanaerobaculales bacterium]|jgi:peptidyl-dipeptidase Dcp|nr:M3 family metallopeptidase [Thermoanaerobaculales bacterium]
MRRSLLCIACLLVLSCAGQPSDAPVAEVNPFFADYGTPFDVQPFDRIEPAHFVPAFEEGMARQDAEVAAIVSNAEPPTFDNTIAALDRSGELLEEVSRVFFALTGSNTSDELQAIEKEISPRLAAHRDAIQMNPELFARIRSLYDARDGLELDREQRFLLERLYQRGVREGALLGEADQERLKGINQRLSELQVEFNANLLAETNAYKLVITDQARLAGLPPAVVETAATTAARDGLESGWVFTTHKPSMLPFLTYADDRELRQQLYTAYTVRGNQGNEHDNKAVIAEIVNLRVDKARLLGYDTYADYVLEERMAGSPERVYELLDQLWAASLPVARREVAEMQAIIDAEGGGFSLAPWDWWYYAEKVRKAKYDLDDNELRPYFELGNVRDGVFYVANRLYGLTFEPLEGMPKPHPDAEVFEVLEADGSHAAVIYMDYHPRESKRQGAWCGRFRSQSRADGVEVDPVINLVCNFTTATADEPALLSLDEVETLFHEFGHALDGILADVTYRTTFRSPDFGELPSQIMEHWAMHPEVLKVYARHYQTGEPIPDELIARIEASSLFNQGFDQVEYLAASLLDMEYHTLNEPAELDVNAFEQAYLESIGLIPEILPRYRTTYFAHIVGGYAAGYYGYMWSGVLDHDAFAAFEETSLFDAETAQRFRTEILEPSGSRDYMEMWLAFRGREPDIAPLLRNLGLE